MVYWNLQSWLTFLAYSSGRLKSSSWCIWACCLFPLCSFIWVLWPSWFQEFYFSYIILQGVPRLVEPTISILLWSWGSNFESYRHWSPLLDWTFPFPTILVFSAHTTYSVKQWIKLQLFHKIPKINKIKSCHKIPKVHDL